jgi:hypothetical protein
MKQALQTARDQFAVYAELHRAKGPGHESKAARNDELVAMCDAALARPEPTADDMARQQWAGMSGADAFLLIDRHADGWSEIGRMMEAWRRSNMAQPELARSVYLVATGETAGGLETYTRHDGAPPPLCDAERIYTSALTQSAELVAVIAERDTLRERLAASEASDAESIRMYRAARDERDRLHASLDCWVIAAAPGGWVHELAAERDQLRAELAAMTADRDSWMRQASDRLDDAVKFGTERDQLRKWKQSRMAVEAEWNPQAVANLLGIWPGRSIRACIMPAVQRLIAERDGLMEQVRDEMDANHELRALGGAASDEDMGTFLRRVISERDQLRAAITEECMLTECVSPDGDPREVLKRLTAWHAETGGGATPRRGRPPAVRP